MHSYRKIYGISGQYDQWKLSDLPIILGKIRHWHIILMRSEASRVQTPLPEYQISLQLSFKFN